MSKSLGNVVEPMEVLDRHGADALRWYLFTATRPGEARRFSGDLVGESLRRFLLTLWNTYSFFVTYANLDGFDPKTADVGAVRERPQLDRWVMSELHTLVRRVTEHLEEYDPTGAGRAIQSFVEDLSNWYVRRSRRRFWKAGSDSDKLAAYHTLYGCLVTLCKLMAPFTPFVAEEMYQNLVRSADSEAPESVHLAEWPYREVSVADTGHGEDTATVDRQLMEDTRLVMRVVSLGRAARSRDAVKVRQPRLKLMVKVAASSQCEAVFRLESHILDELNVKSVECVAGEEQWQLAIERVRNDVRSISWDPVWKARLEAFDKARPVGTVISLEHGAARTEADHDFVLSSNGREDVVIVRVITAELAEEGLARELVHRIQSLRKAAGFDISDHITTYYQGSPSLRAVLAKHGDYVRQETLSEELVEGAPPDGAHAEESAIGGDGEPLLLAVQRV